VVGGAFGGGIRSPFGQSHDTRAACRPVRR
jgi:hypothetical protein